MHRILSILLLAGASLAPVAVAQEVPAPVSPTQISADQGGCSALVTVTGKDGKPIFSAKVSTRVRYGFMGTKKLDLEAFTSAAGQVKIVGLPEVPKKPIFIYVSKDDMMETLEFRPDVRCRASFDVTLK
ncbi:MAG: hypothetical protein P4M01_12315 [Acidobacteriota bacterium]|nr:hypothetical protein [Acidobacteriota bacterium]